MHNEKLIRTPAGNYEPRCGSCSSSCSSSCGQCSFSCSPSCSSDCSSSCDANSEQKAWFPVDTARVLTHEIPERVLRKAMKGGHFNDLEEAKIAGQEWLKYVALCCSSSDKIGMISEKVDEIWHAYILFSREYFAFSRDVLKMDYFHHAPNVENQKGAKYACGGGPSGPKNAGANFIRHYRETFGDLPEIWKQKCIDNSATCKADCGSTCSPGSGCGHGGCY